MYTGPIIDTHMHLWDLANGYAWLSKVDPNMVHLFGDYNKLRRNFLVPDYLALTRGWNIVKSVHVQAFGFPGRPVAETDWLQAQANRYGFPHGIIAYADLSAPDVDATLRQQRARPNVRGIRMPLNYDRIVWRRMADRGNYMRDPQWRRGFALLAGHALSFDMQMYDHQVPGAVALAGDFPTTTIVVEHLAWPIGDLVTRFPVWTKHMAALAACPNVFLKVSGIGVIFRRSDPRLIRRYLRQAVDIFGAGRCMFGSNCPPDTVFYDFGPLIKLYLDTFASLNMPDQHSLFHGTAQRVYRL
jgi:predicted TIM-barrel fold metal-dependent hydrolase